MAVWYHIHKKRKDSLETQAEPAVLRRSYVENQVILEPIPLYCASRCKQTKERGSEDCLWTHIFIFSYGLCQFFFSFKMQRKQDQTAIIGCNLSKKYKVALHKTQNE